MTEETYEDESPARRTQLVNANLLWTFEFGQANYDAADAAAAQLVASNAKLWSFQGLVAQAFNAFFRGETKEAARLVAAAEEQYSEGMDPDLLSLPTYPPSALRGLAMMVKYWLGDMQGADADCETMMEICRSLPAEGGESLPAPLRTVFRDFLVAGSHSFRALLLTLQQDYAGVVNEARAEHAIVASHAATIGAETIFATYDLMAMLYKENAEWVLNGRRDSASRIEPYERMLQSFEVGMKSGASYFYVPLADMHLENGDRAGALAAAQRGLDHAEGHRELAFYAELLAVHAQALYEDDPEASRLEFARALAWAERQDSVPFQLRVAVRWQASDYESGRAPFARAFEACAGKVSEREFDAARAVATRVLEVS